MGGTTSLPSAPGSLSGEALSVADGKEAWIFHVMADDTGASAVWAAQRVPEGHIAVIANDFIIKEIDPEKRGTDFLYSDNMHDIAKKHGLWTPSAEKPLLDFQRAFSVERSQPLYVTRRIWRAFDQVAPGLKLNPDASMYDLPFSVQVESKLSVQQIMDMHRDHFEGTPFDLTKGLAAGPFGDPNRFDGSILSIPMTEILAGRFERPVSLHRTSHTSVTQSRGWLPDIVGGVLWWSEYAPAVSVFTPLWPGQNSLSKTYSTGSMYALDRNVAWWAYCALGNYAQRSYSYIIEDINAAQRLWESRLWTQQAEIEKAVVERLRSAHNNGADIGDEHALAHVRNQLTKYANGIAEEITADWWSLFDRVITKFHDGYRMDDLHSDLLKPTKLFYPMWWLQQVGYFPPGYHATPATVTATVTEPLVKPPTTTLASTVESSLFPESSFVAPAASSSSSSSSGAMVAACVLAICIGAGIGFAAARKTEARAGGYELIA